MTWTLPQIQLPTAQETSVDVSTLSDVLISTLHDLGAPAQIERVLVGASTIKWELIPESKVRCRDFTRLGRRDDISLALGAETVRIEAPIPGTQVVSVEI